MRGTFFAKHLRQNRRGKTVDNLASSQATRTKVANAVVTSKAVAEAKEEKLWWEAGKSAFKYADKKEEQYADKEEEQNNS